MKLGLIGIVTASALALSACVSSSGGTAPPLGAVRVVNAVSDSSVVASAFSGLVQIASMLAYGSASGFTVQGAGTYNVGFTVTPADGSDNFVINAPNIPLDQYRGTTVYATGTVASPNSYFVEAPVSLTQGQVQLQLVDVASQTSGALDIYIVPPTSDIGSAEPVTTLQYLGNSTTQYPGDSELNNYAGGTYELIITAAGDKTPLYDSGPNGIALGSTTGGASLQIAVLDAPNQPDGSPVSLLELDNTGQNDPVTLKNGAN